MSYCINPRCNQRENPDEAQACLFCDTPLLINGRFHILHPIRPVRLDHATDVFEVIDEVGSWISSPGAHKVMKVLKSRDEDLIKLQEAEAHCLQMLDHTGIPRVDLEDRFAVTIEAMPFPLHCLVMDKVEGQTLEEWVEEHGRILQQTALDWLAQLAQILDHVHQRGFFHRDIKPSNIILKPDGTLALIDFGGAREVTDTYFAKISGSGSGSRASRHREITVIRSTRYSAPEQEDGQAVPQSDFFALGRTLIYLVTGVPLIQLPTEPETRKLLWHKQAPQIDQPVADFLDNLMEPNPDKRPKNTQSILNHLQKRLPRQLKRYRMRRSPLFRAVVILLGALSVYGVYKTHHLANYYYYFFIGLQSQRSELPGSLAEAQVNYEQALQFNPKSVLARINLAQVYLDQGKADCALLEYQQAIAQDSQNGAAYQGLGLLYDQQNQFAKAKDAFDNSAKYGNNDTGIVSNALARIFNRQGDYKAALPNAQQAVALAKTPQDKAVGLKYLAWAQFGQGQVQEQQGQSKQAEANFREAQKHLEFSIRLDPIRPDAYCLLAQVQQTQGNQASANGNWQECLQRNNSLDLPEVNQWRDQVLRRIYGSGYKKAPGR